MQNVFISLDANTLKISFETKEGIETLNTEVAGDVCKGSVVVNTESFAQVVAQVAKESGGFKRGSAQLHFIVEPQDCWLFYLTSDKKAQDPQKQLIDEASQKLEGVSLEELYFSYEKIAPFVYQFVGIRKTQLESYLEISNLLGMPIKSVISWVLALPKYVSVSEPSIFVVGRNNKHVVAVSELNGVFFSGVFDQLKYKTGLDKILKSLSVYGRRTPIRKVYTLGEDLSELGPEYRVERIDIPTENMEFGLHFLINSLLQYKDELLDSQFNLLNLLPLPSVEKSKPSLAYVGAAGAVVCILLIGVYFGFSKGIFDRILKQGQPQSVLSETKESTQSSGSNQSGVEQQKNELNKADLRIKVENGAGISGAAAKTQAFLEKKGYKVAEIGNAEIVGRQNTLLQFKKESARYKDLVESDLKDNYLDIVVQDDLDSSSSFDLLIIVGTEVKDLD